MRLVVDQEGGYDYGADGTTFNCSHDPIKPVDWGGRWDGTFVNKDILSSGDC